MLSSVAAVSKQQKPTKHQKDVEGLNTNGAKPAS